MSALDTKPARITGITTTTMADPTTAASDGDADNMSTGSNSSGSSRSTSSGPRTPSRLEQLRARTQKLRLSSHEKLQKSRRMLNPDYDDSKEADEGSSSESPPVESIPQHEQILLQEVESLKKQLEDYHTTVEKLKSELTETRDELDSTHQQLLEQPWSDPDLLLKNEALTDRILDLEAVNNSLREQHSKFLHEHEKRTSIQTKGEDPYQSLRLDLLGTAQLQQHLENASVASEGSSLEDSRRLNKRLADFVQELNTRVNELERLKGELLGELKSVRSEGQHKGQLLASLAQELQDALSRESATREELDFAQDRLQRITLEAGFLNEDMAVELNQVKEKYQTLAQKRSLNGMVLIEGTKSTSSPEEAGGVEAELHPNNEVLDTRSTAETAIHQPSEEDEGTLERTRKLNKALATQIEALQQRIMDLESINTSLQGRITDLTKKSSASHGGNDTTMEETFFHEEDSEEPLQMEFLSRVAPSDASSSSSSRIMDLSDTQGDSSNFLNGDLSEIHHKVIKTTGDDALLKSLQEENKVLRAKLEALEANGATELEAMRSASAKLTKQIVRTFKVLNPTEDTEHLLESLNPKETTQGDSAIDNLTQQVQQLQLKVNAYQDVLENVVEAKGGDTIEVSVSVDPELVQARVDIDTLTEENEELRSKIKSLEFDNELESVALPVESPEDDNEVQQQLQRSSMAIVSTQLAETTLRSTALESDLTEARATIVQLTSEVEKRDEMLVTSQKELETAREHLAQMESPKKHPNNSDHPVAESDGPDEKDEVIVATEKELNNARMMNVELQKKVQEFLDTSAAAEETKKELEAELAQVKEQLKSATSSADEKENLNTAAGQDADKTRKFGTRNIVQDFVDGTAHAEQPKSDQVVDADMVEKLSKEVSVLRSKLVALEACNQVLVGDVESLALDAESAELLEEIANQTHNKVLSQLVESTLRRSALEVELSDVGQKLDMLTIDAWEKEDRLASTAEELENARLVNVWKQMEDARRENAALTEEVEELRLRVGSLEATNFQLESNALNSESVDLLTQLAESTMRISSLEEELSDAHERLGLAAQDADEREEMLVANEDDLEQSRINNQEMSHELRLLQSKVESLEARNKELAAEVESLAQKILAAELEAESGKQLNRSFATKLAESDLRNSGLEAELEEAAKKLALATSDAADKNKQLVANRKELDQASILNQQITDEKKQLLLHNGSLESKNRELADEIESLSMQAESGEVLQRSTRAIMSTQLAERNLRSSSLQTELDETKENLAIATREAEHQVDLLAGSRKELEQARNDNARLNKANQELLSNAVSLEATIKELEEEVETFVLQAELGELDEVAQRSDKVIKSTQLAEASLRNTALEAELVEISEELELVGADLDAKDEELIASKKSLENARAVILRLTEKNQSLRSKVGSLEASNEDLVGNVESLAQRAESVELGGRLQRSTAAIVSTQLAEASLRSSALAAELAGTEEQLVAAKSDAERMAGVLVSREAELEENRLECDRMRLKVASLESANQELVQEVESLALQAESVELGEVLHRSTATIVSTQLAETSLRSFALEAELAETKEQLEHAHADVERMDKMLSTRGSYLEEARMANRELQSKLSSLEATNRDLMDEVETLVLQAELGELDEVAQRSDKAIKSTQLAEASLRNTALEAELVEISEELELVGADLDAKDEELIASKKSLENARAVILRLTEKNQSLRSKVGSLEAANEDLVGNVESLAQRAESVELGGRLQRSTAAIVSTQLAEASLRSSALAAELAGTEEQLVAAKSDAERMAGVLVSREAELEENRLECDRMRLKVASLESANQELVQEVESLALQAESVELGEVLHRSTATIVSTQLAETSLRSFALEAELAETKEQLEHAHADVERMDKMLSTRGSYLEEARGTIQELQSKLSSLEATNKDLVEEVEMLALQAESVELEEVLQRSTTAIMSTQLAETSLRSSALEADLAGAKEMLDVASADADRLDMMLVTRQIDLAEARATNQKLESKVVSLEATNKELVNEVEKLALQAESVELEEVLQRSTTAIMSTQLAETSLRSSTLETELEETKEMLTEATADADRLDKMLATHQLALSQAQVANQKLEAEVVSLEAANRDLVDEVEMLALQAESVELEEVLQSSTTAIMSTQLAETSLRSSTLEAQLAEAKEMLHAATVDADRLEKMLVTSLDDFEQAQIAIENLQSNVDELEATNENLVNKFDSLKVEAESVKLEETRQRSTSAIMSTRLSESHLRSSALTSELAETKEKLADAISQAVDLDETLESKDSELEKAREIILNLTEVVQDQQAKIGSLEATNQDLVDEVEELALQAESVELEDALQRSTNSIVSTKLAETSFRSTTLESQLLETKKMFDSATSDLQERDRTVELKSSELLEARLMNQQLESEISELHAKVGQLQATNTDLVAEVESLALQAESAELEEVLQRSTSAIVSTQLAEAGLRGSTMEAELLETKEMLDRANSDSDLKDKELISMETELGKASKANSKLQDEMQALQSRVGLLEASNRELISEVETLALEAESLELDEILQRSTTRILSAQLEAREADVAEISTKLATITCREREMLEEMEELNHELSRTALGATRAKDEANAVLLALEEQLQIKENEEQIQEELINSLTSQLEARETEASEFGVKLAAISSREKEMLGEMEELNREFSRTAQGATRAEEEASAAILELQEQLKIKENEEELQQDLINSLTAQLDRSATLASKEVELERARAINLTCRAQIQQLQSKLESLEAPNTELVVEVALRSEPAEFDGEEITHARSLDMPFDEGGKGAEEWSPAEQRSRALQFPVDVQNVGADTRTESPDHSVDEILQNRSFDLPFDEERREPSRQFNAKNSDVDRADLEAQLREKTKEVASAKKERQAELTELQECLLQTQGELHDTRCRNMDLADAVKALEEKVDILENNNEELLKELRSSGRRASMELVPKLKEQLYDSTSRESYLLRELATVKNSLQHDRELLSCLSTELYDSSQREGHMRKELADCSVKLETLAKEVGGPEAKELTLPDNATEPEPQALSDRGNRDGPIRDVNVSKISVDDRSNSTRSGSENDAAQVTRSFDSLFPEEHQLSREDSRILSRELSDQLNEELTQQVEVLQGRIKELEETRKEEIQAARKEKSRKLNERYEQMKKSLTSLTSVLGELTSSNKALTARIGELETELEEKEEERQKLQRRLAADETKGHLQRSSISIVSTQLAETKARNTSLEEIVDDLKVKLQTSGNGENSEALIDDLDYARTLNDEMMAKIEELENVVETLLVEKRAAMDENVELEAELQEYHIALDEAREKLDKSQIAEGRWQAKCEIAEAEVTAIEKTMHAELESCKNELQNERFSSQVIKDAIVTLNGANDRLLEDKRKLAEELELMRPENRDEGDLEKENRLLSEECKFLRAQKKNFARKEQDMEAKLKRYEEEKHTLLKEGQQLTARIEAMVKAYEEIQKSLVRMDEKHSQELKGATDEKNWIEEKLTKSQKSIMDVSTKMKTMRATLTSEIDELRDGEVRLTKEVMMVRAKLAEYTQEIADLEEDLEANRQEAKSVVEELRAQLDSLQSENISLTNELESIRSEKDSLEDQVLAQSSSMEELRKERDELTDRETTLKKDISLWF